VSVNVRDLGRGVYLVESPRHASGLVCTHAGAVVVDPGPRGETGGALLELLEQTGTRAGYVVATRAGRERAPGAGLFPDALLLYPSPGESPRAEGPSAAFTRDAFLRVGGVAVELLRAPEPEGGVLVRLPGRQLLFAGAVSNVEGAARPVWSVDPRRLVRTHRVRHLVPAGGGLWEGGPDVIRPSQDGSGRPLRATE